MRFPWIAFGLFFAFGCSSSSSDASAGPDADDSGITADVAATDSNVTFDTRGDVTSESGADAPVDAGPSATVHFIGRFDTTDPAGPKFEWPASAIMARFTGTGVSAKLKDGDNNYFEVVIDGATTSSFQTSSSTTSYVLASGLSAGTHDVVLYRRTESFFGTSQFLGFDVAGGALVATPAPFARTLEIVGDSISCGYGDEGAGPTCTFTPATEDEYMSYGAIAARALNAAQVTVAWSGKGIYRNYDGSTTELMPELWQRTLPQSATSSWSFTGYVPDVVVIDLGTNDFAKGDPGAPFQDAWVTFFKSIRDKYPSAFIFGAVGSMLDSTRAAQDKSYIQAAIDARKAAGDTKLGLVEFATQDATADGIGCDYHPSVKTHEKMAAVLTAAIKAQMGW